MGSTNEYQFVPLDESNIDWLIPLYKKVFNRVFTPETIRAKYFPNHTGIKAQGHFALYNNNPVAFHGAIPMLMTYHEETQLAAQYGDAMTLPEHAGNGLFTKLGELTDQELIHKGVRFVWGFPNQNSEYGYVNKLHWQGERRMNCYTLILSKLSREVLSRKSGFLKEGQQKKIASKLQKVIRPRLMNNYSLEVVSTLKNEDYYSYKHFTPNHIVEVEGCLVWVKTEGGLLVGDVQFDQPEQLENLYPALQKLAKQLGLNKIIFQVAPETPLDQFLRNHLSPISSWLIGYKNFNSEFPLEKLELCYGDLDTF